MCNLALFIRAQTQLDLTNIYMINICLYCDACSVETLLLLSSSSHVVVVTVMLFLSLPPHHRGRRFRLSTQPLSPVILCTDSIFWPIESLYSPCWRMDDVLATIDCHHTETLKCSLQRHHPCDSQPLQSFLLHRDMQKCVTHQGSADAEELLIKSTQTWREWNKVRECKEKWSLN